MDPALLQLLGKIVGPGGPLPLGAVTIGDQTYTQYGGLQRAREHQKLRR